VALLELENVEARYGQVIALHGVALQVPEGRMVAVLGANGAGKTTTLRAISGLIRPTRGVIRFAGDDLAKHSPDAIVRLGIGHSPEGRRVFARIRCSRDRTVLTGRPRVIGSSVSPRRERVGAPSLIGICRPPGGLPNSRALSTAIDTSALRERSRKPVRERSAGGLDNRVAAESEQVLVDAEQRERQRERAGRGGGRRNGA